MIYVYIHILTALISFIILYLTSHRSPDLEEVIAGVFVLSIFGPLVLFIIMLEGIRKKFHKTKDNYYD